ncbi:MAG: manganese catalase family protein [Lachnospiraceae bacterium]|nr:manganese catalase family protein [Lachnospiraceae bacterium]
MWSYEKRLQYPVNIKNKDPKIAQIIISQYGGPDGEIGASLRYLSQKYSMKNPRIAGLLNDIGTEELAHLEIVGAIVHQLTDCLTPEQIEASGFAPYYVDHTLGVYPQSAGGTPFTATVLQSKGDPITDLFEDMAAEQKARTTYDNILRLVKDPDVADPIKFLRKREIIHFQRFGEGLRMLQEELDSKNFYAFNPSIDLCNCKK